MQDQEKNELLTRISKLEERLDQMNASSLRLERVINAIYQNSKLQQNVLYDLDSYALNDFAEKHCPELLCSPRVKKLHELLDLLRVKEIVPSPKFVRAGKKGDGGYVIVDKYPRGGAHSLQFRNRRRCVV